MAIEGYLKIQPNGRYAVCGEGKPYELTSGECIEVNIDQCWIVMRIEHDGKGYYLLSDNTAFYPKKVYARYDSNFRRF